jgi:hypothetical protein
MLLTVLGITCSGLLLLQGRKHQFNAVAPELKVHRRAAHSRPSHRLYRKQQTYAAVIAVDDALAVTSLFAAAYHTQSVHLSYAPQGARSAFTQLMHRFCKLQHGSANCIIDHLQLDVPCKVSQVDS